MKEFEKLSTEKVNVFEEGILKYWKENKIFEKSIENREKYFVFYDGPATANGMPGLHHMVAKFLKDTICKYKTMKGYKVIRKVGWDTHGLPVELEVEKQLGFKSKNDIEEYGIKEFNEKCKESVWKNEKAFTELTEKMGQFIDTDNPYVTYDNNYIETEWWILKKLFDEGLIYEGHKILPFCIRCGTGLASHEVAQGYQEIAVNSVIVPMKKKDEENTYFLVWTTTPWTLLSNVALCVNPKETYVKVESMGYNFILSKTLMPSVLGEDVKILKEYKGSDLEYQEYEQLLPFIKVNKKAFFVTCADYVTTEDGTGIVHIAPAFGEDDYNVGKKYDLPVVNPVGEDGKYLEGPWKGTLVFDADIEIIKYLKENDKLFKKIKLMHNYPHCWRCSTPLLYYSKPSYYIKTTAFKDKIIKENNKVNWHPSFVGEKRFGNWLENMNDWAISRNRYWGTPLPLWTCECGEKIMIGSRKELVSKSIQKIDETIELHRPYVDEIEIKCEKCGKTMHRVKDVIDCWFDSGSMPFAQYHYPFGNEEIFKHQFPADFISEGIDQTRGWFYVLLVISIFVMGKAPYKNVLVNDLLLDKYGKKMSKSKGNTIDPFNLINTFGADTIRWYFPYVSSVWTPLKFDEEGLKEIYSKFISTLKSTYNFFALYANTDKLDPKEFEVKYEDLEEIDLWLLSKYNKLVKYVSESYDEYDLTKVVRSITDFVSEDLSNWYIRRNRKRFWASALDNNKKAVYKTTYDVLVGISQMCAPIMPFLSEEMYINLTGKESVHLSDFPKYNEKYLNDEVEERMDCVRKIISLGRFIREEAKVKVRQPISEAILDKKLENKISDLVSLIKEELNVKEVIFTTELSNYVNYDVRPNYKVCGSKFGSKINAFVGLLKNLSTEQINKLENNEEIELLLDNENIKVNLEMVDIRVISKQGFNSVVEGNLFVVLNTNLTEDLINEGIAREFISKIQNLRKTRDYNIVDRINIYYEKNKEFEKCLETNKEFIMRETLALSVEEKENLSEKQNINGLDLSYDIEVTKEIS